MAFDLSDYFGGPSAESEPMYVPDVQNLPPTSMPTDSFSAGDLFSTVKAGANTLLDVWGTVKKAEYNAAALETQAAVQRAQLSAAKDSQLNAIELAKRQDSARTNVELTRSSAIAQSASAKAFGVDSKTLLYGAAGVIGLLVVYRMTRG